MTQNVYRVEVIEHTMLHELQRRVNEWLKGANWRIERVIGVYIAKADGLYLASILYTERAE